MQDLSYKLSVPIQAILLEELNKFAGYTACAGLQGLSDEDYKAALINNYGSVGGMIPARPFIDAATGNGQGLKLYEKQLMSLITKRMRNIRPTGDVKYRDVLTYRGEARIDPATGKPMLGSRRSVSTGVFKTKDGSRGGGYTIMKEIAKQMAKAQTNYISHGSADYFGAAMPEPNKASTEKRKGFNHPLVETGEMFRKIKGWVD